MDIKVQEYGTLKVPYEILNKKFRSAQKSIDKELHTVAGTLSELEKKVESQNLSRENVVSLLDTVVEKLQNMKRKAVDAIGIEEEAAKLCKRRVEHLKDHAKPELSHQWKKIRFDRMVVDHLLRSGLYETAMQLAKDSGIEDLVNISVFTIAWEVEQSLEQQDSSRCLEWCYDNRSRLRKLKSTLEFSLRLQEFIELVRRNRRFEAIRHARKYFGTAEGQQLNEVKSVMGLLAFPSDTHISPYKDLFAITRWQHLKEQFRYENYRLHQLSDLSIFKVTLQAGLSGLKTHKCYLEHERSTDCPVCSPLFNDLAKALPYAHCTQSRLICAITGEIMNEHNPPMVLPNGHIYGQHGACPSCSQHRLLLPVQGLTQTARNGKVRCPRTNEEFDVDSVGKVFVM